VDQNLDIRLRAVSHDERLAWRRPDKATVKLQGKALMLEQEEACMSSAFSAFSVSTCKERHEDAHHEDGMTDQPNLVKAASTTPFPSSTVSQTSQRADGPADDGMTKVFVMLLPAAAPLPWRRLETNHDDDRWSRSRSLHPDFGRLEKRPIEQVYRNCRASGVTRSLTSSSPLPTIKQSNIIIVAGSSAFFQPRRGSKSRQLGP